MVVTEDSELLRRFAVHRDEAAFAALVARHIDLVYSTARRVLNGDCDLAEDVTQRVFADFARKACDLPSEVTLAGWFYQAARFCAANTVRSEQRRKAREQEAFAMNQTSETAPAWQEVVPHLDAAMAELENGDRDVILLRFFQKQDYKSIGGVLGLSDDTAQKRVARALERLRQLLVRRGVAVGASALGILISANASQAAPALLATSISTSVMTASAATGAGAVSAKVFALSTAKLGMAGVAMFALVSLLALRPWDGKARLLSTGNVRPTISMGATHGIILAGDGTLWSWGESFAGWPVLGTGAARQPKLRRIGTDTNWLDVSTSFSHAICLKADGSVWSWGENIHGQLGLGPGGAAVTQRILPTRVLAGNDWKEVAAGGAHSLALKRDGTLWAWGNNWAGQLGIGAANPEILEPTKVGTGSNWVRVWAAGVQSVGQQADGSLWFWGTLTGSATDTNRMYVPTRISTHANWSEVGFGYFVIFAIKTDGTLWAWGRNSGIYTGAPIQLSNPNPERVGSDADWQSCSTSEYFYHVLQKKDGSIWAMNASDHAKVGQQNYRSVRFHRVPISDEVVAFGAAGRGLTGVAVTRKGEVWTWGRVLGDSAWAYPRVQAAATAIGWKTSLFAGKPITRQQPWLLSRE